MPYREQDIVHEVGKFWVLREGNTYKVFETGVTHSIRVALFAAGAAESRRRAIEHCNHRAGVEN